MTTVNHASGARLTPRKSAARAHVSTGGPDENARLIREAFAARGVEYMFIGAGSTILQGFNDTTQDVDVMPEKSAENAESIILALTDLGFPLDEGKKRDIRRGKDFVQFKIPFEFDLIYAPDGFNSYGEAAAYKKDVQGYPCMSVRGVIRSKRAAGRPKDLAKLPLLEAFARHLEGGGR